MRRFAAWCSVVRAARWGHRSLPTTNNQQPTTNNYRNWGHRFLPIFVLCACCSALGATDFVWTDAGGDHRWGNAKNWAGGAVPNQKDANVVFTNRFGDVSVILDEGSTKGVWLANGITVKGAANVTIKAAQSGYYITNTHTGADNPSFLNVAKGGALYLEAEINFPNRVELAGEGDVYYRSKFTQGGDTFGFLCGRHYFESNSVISAKAVNVGDGDAYKDNFCGLYFSGNAQFTCAGAFNMGCSANAPEAEVVVDGDGVELTSSGVATFGYAESTENTQVFRLMRGKVKMKEPKFSFKRPAEFVQEGGVFTSDGTPTIGRDIQSTGRFALEGGEFVSSGGVYGSSGSAVGIELSGGKLTVNGNVECDIRVTGLGGELCATNSGTSTLCGMLEIAEGATLKTTGTRTIQIQRNFTVDGAMDVGGAGFKMNNCGVVRKAVWDKAWRLTIRQGAKFTVNTANTYFWHMPDVVAEVESGKETESGLVLNSRNACFVNSFAYAVNGVTNEVLRGRYVSTSSTAAGPGMPAVASTYGNYYVKPYVWTGNGGDGKWSTTNNWLDGIAPDTADRAKGVDLTAATAVELDEDENGKTTVGCVLFASPECSPTLTFTSAHSNALTVVPQQTYSAVFEAMPQSRIVFAAPLRAERLAYPDRRELGIYLGGATYEVRTPIMYGTENSWAFGVGGRFVYNSTIPELQQTTGRNLLVCGGTGSFEPAKIVYGPDADITFNNHYFAQSGYTTIECIRQEGAKMTGVGVYASCRPGDFRYPATYTLSAGTLTLSKCLGTGTYDGQKSSSGAAVFERGSGGSFVMTGGTLNVPVIECEENQNYIYLYGGTVNLGSGGFVHTDDANGRKNYTHNANPALNLGGVMLNMTAAAVNGLDTVLTGEGGATVVEGEKLTFAEEKTVSGSGALVARCPVVFKGTLSGSPSLTAEGAGVIQFWDDSEVTGYPTFDIPTDEALRIADGTTIKAVRVTVGGEPLAEGSYAGRFGAGTLVVSTAMPDDSDWTGAGGDFQYFTPGNWQTGTPPNGSSATADFGNAVFMTNTTITVGQDPGGFLGDLTLKKLTAPCRAEDLTLKIVEGVSLKLVNEGEIAIPAGHTLTIDGKVALPAQTSRPAKTVSVTGGGKLILKGTVVNDSSSTDFTSYTPRMIARDGSEIVLACKSEGGVQFYTATADQYSLSPSKVTVTNGADMALCDIPSWYSIAGDVSKRGAFTVDGGRIAFETGAFYRNSLMNNTSDGISGTPTSVVTLNGGEIITPQGMRCMIITTVNAFNRLVLNGGTWRQSVAGAMADRYINVDLTGLTTLDVAQDVTFEANLAGTGGGLAKTGDGSLALMGLAEGMTTLDIQTGTGTLSETAAGSLSRNLAIHIPSTTAALNLDYDGIVTIREMWIGGQQRARGLYSATRSTAEEFNHFFTGNGELQVLSGDALGVILIVR